MDEKNIEIRKSNDKIRDIILTNPNSAVCLTWNNIFYNNEIVVGIEDKNITEVISNNYPNPFSESTQIRFNVPPDLGNEHVVVNIFTLDGTKVNCIVNENLPSNNYSVVWNGTDFSGKKLQSGTYLYEIIIGERKQSGKMILSK